MKAELITAPVSHKAFTPELQQIVEQGKEVLSKGNKTTVLMQHRIGSLLLQVEKHVLASEVDDTIAAISQEWGIDPRNLNKLYAAKLVAQAFSLAFVREQMEQPLSNGGYLSWTHFVQLQKAQDPLKIEALLSKVRENALTSKELALEMAGESAIVRSGGRRPSVPASPRAMIRKVTLSTQQTSNYLNSVIGPLDELITAGVEYDDKLSDELASAVSQLSVMSAQEAEALRRVKQLQSRLGKKPKEAAPSEPKPTKGKRGRKPGKQKSAATEAASETVAVATVPGVVSPPTGVRRRVPRKSRS